MSMRIVETVLPSAHLGGESTLPSVYEMSNVQNQTRTQLDEDDGLFVGYGFLPSVFPYRMQDLYDRASEPTVYQGVILENRYLKALFLPELGGRLWSLYDKAAGKELLYKNPVVRPCNLAVRNAWLAGGIEFNCGMVGHHPFTCSPIFACETRLSDGTPVLRMYEFERIRRCVYQMDFFLPEDSKMLFGRMRIVNPNDETVPMYWWTNMAVREDPEARDVIDATETYNNRNGVGKNPVPFFGGIDITYPTNNPTAIDFFWKLRPGARRFTAHIGKDGSGFCQVSTERLQGRKLFVWGQGEGGARWQEFLTDTSRGENGRYVEIQAGLAKTQYECLPMPPKTAWEWLEAFGPIQADPTKVHGDWADARAEVSDRLSRLITAETMERMLDETREMAKSPAKTPFCMGAGWGALERLRREKAQEPDICPHLDFGSVGPEQQPWLSLLNDGSLPKNTDGTPPVSWMLQREWTALLEASPDSAEKWLHLAAVYMASCRQTEAELALEKTLAWGESAIGLFLKAQTQRLRGETRSAAETAMKAVALLPDDVSLSRQAFAMAVGAGLYDAVLAAYGQAPVAIRADGRVAMFYAFALLHTGMTERAEQVLYADGGLAVTDIREGEFSITSLYLEIAEAKAKAKGEVFDPAEVTVPRQFDFRMSVPKKNCNS